MEPDKQLIFKTKQAEKKAILMHLTECNDSFVPPLNERTDLNNYSNKIVEKAITFEAWNADLLIGLIAAYFNNADSPSAFITNVSVVKKFKGMGIATTLLKNCIDYSINNNCFEIYLEVNKENIPAINFYKKNNFTQIATKEDNLVLKLAIK
jgi:ribosomal protein S18 acetylase RimI-like enzyme